MRFRSSFDMTAMKMNDRPNERSSAGSPTRHAARARLLTSNL